MKIRPDKNIGYNIQNARNKKGYTQEETVAKLQIMGIDISRSTYAKIETNRMNIKVSELIAISKLFNVDFNYLFNDIEL